MFSSVVVPVFVQADIPSLKSFTELIPEFSNHEALTIVKFTPTNVKPMSASLDNVKLYYAQVRQFRLMLKHESFFALNRYLTLSHLLKQLLQQLYIHPRLCQSISDASAFENQEVLVKLHIFTNQLFCVV